MKRPLALLTAFFAVTWLLTLPASLLAATQRPASPANPELPASSPEPPAPSDTQNSQPPPTQPEESGSPPKAQPSQPQVQAEATRTSHPKAVAAGPGTVTIRDFTFSPGSLTVHVGDTVTWSNQGPSGHSATANDGSFDTGVLSKGASGSFTFRTPGKFSYHCTPHPFMHASITVLAASSGAGGGGSTSEGAAAAGKVSGGAKSSSSRSAAGAGRPSLPRTGLDIALVAAVGLLLLGLGALVRRKAAPDS